MVTLQMMVLTFVFLVGNALWFAFLFMRADPWLRKRIGTHYGVTIDLTGKGLWKVKESGQGGRGCLIELVQPVFVIPVAFVSMLCFGMLFLFLSP
jgi:hypothetical protein